MHGEMLIDGHFIGGPCDQSIPKAIIRSPYDNRLVRTAAEGDELALMTAIDAAHSAYSSWSRTPRTDRANILHRVAATVRERRTELSELLVDEIGKPITLAEGEVDRMALTFELAANLAVGFGTESLNLNYDPRGKDYECYVERFPVGVVFAIVPYNWPFNLTAHKVAPALAVGNTVVIKPSPQALLATYALGRLLHECGVPPGVVNVVDAPVPAVEKALLDVRVRMVSFTGSDKVGWKVKSYLPPTTKCTLELGGDASVIVCADADLDWATQRLVPGSFGYAGQICISVQHVLVERSVYDPLVAMLVAGATKCQTGNPSLPETICGPLISSQAADRVQAWVEEVAEGGGQVLSGGQREGNIVSPTLLGDVPPDSQVAKAEVFGPVLTLEPFDTLSDATAKVNTSIYGIQAGVFTSSNANADACYRDLEVGGVVVNDTPTQRFDSFPYGGVKQSGFGREGVASAMEDMTEPKTRLSRTLLQ